MLIVIHTNGQEIIGEEPSDSVDPSKILLKKPFVLDREHVSMQESIGTMILLDSIGDEISVPRSQSWPRPASVDEQKTYDHMVEMASPIKKAKMSDLKLINRE